MNLNEYQQLAARTLIPQPEHEISQQQWDMVNHALALMVLATDVLARGGSCPGRQDMTLWNITGLLGEVGELIDVVKKDVFHQHPTDPDIYKKEVGDALWYWAACCTVAGYEASSLSDIAKINQYAETLARFFRLLGYFVETFMPFTLEEAMSHNIEKLKQRYPNGFDPVDSLKRVDVA